MRQLIFAFNALFSSCLIPLNGGGLFLYEIAAPDLGLASAGWSARAQDASTLFTNPAGLSNLEYADLQVGLEPIYIHAQFEPNYNETTDLGTAGDASTWIPSGSVFYASPQSNGFSWGVGGLGYFGSALDFGDQWVGRYQATKSVLQGFSLVASGAYQVTDKLSVGLGVTGMYAIMDQQSAINNKIDQQADGLLTYKDNTFGGALIAGILYQLSCNFRVGVSYLSEMSLHFNDIPQISNIGPILKEALIDAGLLDASLKMKMHLPQSVMVGFFGTVSPQFNVMGDFGWQQWSRFGRVTIEIDSEQPKTLVQNYDFKDTWHSSLGGQYRLNNAWQLSIGAAYDSSFVTEFTRPVDTPIGATWRFGGGLSWAYSPCLSVDFGYEFATAGNLNVDHQGGPLAGRVVGTFKNAYTQFFNLEVNVLF
jgi:Long-chain fatty acid transport protein